MYHDTLHIVHRAYNYFSLAISSFLSSSALSSFFSLPSFLPSFYTSPHVFPDRDSLGTSNWNLAKICTLAGRSFRNDCLPSPLGLVANSVPRRRSYERNTLFREIANRVADRENHPRRMTAACCENSLPPHAQSYLLRRSSATAGSFKEETSCV